MYMICDMYVYKPGETASWPVPVLGLKTEFNNIFSH